MSSAINSRGQQVDLPGRDANMLEKYGHQFPPHLRKWLPLFELKVEKGYRDWELAPLCNRTRGHVSRQLALVKKHFRRFL